MRAVVERQNALRKKLAANSILSSPTCPLLHAYFSSLMQQDKNSSMCPAPAKDSDCSKGTESAPIDRDAKPRSVTPFFLFRGSYSGGGKATVSPVPCLVLVSLAASGQAHRVGQGQGVEESVGREGGGVSARCLARPKTKRANATAPTTFPTTNFFLTKTLQARQGRVYARACVMR